MTDAVVVVESRARVGECPLWDAAARCLWWIDIYKPAINRFELATGASASLPMPEPVGCIALRQSGGLLAGLARGFAFVDPMSGAVERMVDPEPDRPNNRLNDGRCDRQGRFWAGSMVEDRSGPHAALWRLDPDRSIHRMVDQIMVSNGLAWSPDGRTMYHADTRQSTVWAWDFDSAAGAIANRRVFAKAADGEGRPDGACVDEEGCYWSARFGGWRLVRHAPDGREIQVVKMPVANPTMPAFGGEKLDVLYVTSAAQGVTEEMRAQQPHAGSVFALDVGVRGLAEPRFAG